MKKIINIGNDFSTKLSRPIVADDTHSYEIVYTAPEDISDSFFNIMATRADGEKVADAVLIEKGSVAKYTLAGSMYAIPGTLKIRTSVVKTVSGKTSTLTTNEIICRVIEKTGEGSTDAETNVSVVDEIQAKVGELNGSVSKLKEDVASIDEKDSMVLSTAKEHTNEKVTEAKDVAKTYTDGKISDVEKNTKAYTDEKTSKALSDAKKYADEASFESEQNAKDYADEKVSSIKQVEVTMDIKDTDQSKAPSVVLVSSLLLAAADDIERIDQKADESLSSAKDYTDEKANTAEQNAKAYADEQFKKPFIPKECNNVDYSTYVYSPCKEPMHVNLMFSNYEKKSDTEFILTSADFLSASKLNETYVFYAGQTKGFKCSLTSVNGNKFTFKTDADVIDMSIKEFGLAYEKFGIYDGEYKWAKTVDEENLITSEQLVYVLGEIINMLNGEDENTLNSAKTYTDIAIQQAILDSWEVGV